MALYQTIQNAPCDAHWKHPDTDLTVATGFLLSCYTDIATEASWQDREVSSYSGRRTCYRVQSTRAATTTTSWRWRTSTTRKTGNGRGLPVNVRQLQRRCYRCLCCSLSWSRSSAELLASRLLALLASLS